MTSFEKKESTSMSTKIQQITSLPQTFGDESGLSLLEILAAIMLIGLSFGLLGTLIYQNNQAINLNKRKEEAIFVREDIKEWLAYKAQMQDLINLNTYTFISSNHTYSPEETNRREHFILDETGIQKEGGTAKAVYGEIRVSESEAANRGTFIRKVAYDIGNANFLPKKLNGPENQLYIGHYLNQAEEGTDFLVEVKVKWKSKQLTDYNPRVDGVRLQLIIYDKKTGMQLTETMINWIAES